MVVSLKDHLLILRMTTIIPRVNQVPPFSRANSLLERNQAKHILEVPAAAVLLNTKLWSGVVDGILKNPAPQAHISSAKLGRAATWKGVVLPVAVQYLKLAGSG